MQRREIWKGSEAIAEAAIRAGCKGFFGYPITPQNEIPEYMSAHMAERGGVFVQAESELSSINLGSRIDSTPSVYGNYLVVGTRGKGGDGDAPKIVCVKIN